MQITMVHLGELRDQAEREQRRSIAQAQQAVGAIAAIDALIAQMKMPEEKEPQP